MDDRLPNNQSQDLSRRVLSAIGRQQWMDRPSYRLEHLLSFGYNGLGRARNGITNALNGVWLGHPVHPPLASLTSGALATTVLLDATSLLPAQPVTEARDASRFASRALGMGILVSVCSALTGTTDWQHTHQEQRRVGLVHGVVSVAATALCLRSWWDRRSGHRGRGIVLTALGYGLAAIGSYLGGVLVFDSGIGTDRSGRRLHSTEWTPVFSENSLNGKPIRVEVDGEGLVVCQSEAGEVSASHMAAPMADGWLDRGRLVCLWHGNRQVLRGPSPAPLPCYWARLVNGMAKTAMASSAANGRRSEVNAYDVLEEHYVVTTGLGRRASEACRPVNTAERTGLRAGTRSKRCSRRTRTTKGAT